MNRPKSSPRLKGQQHSGANVIILQIVSTYNAKTEEDFGAKSSSKTARMAKLRQFSQGHPRPAFSKKGQGGDQGKFFKTRSKRSNRLKNPKALWRKWHYPLICKHLNCKDWRRFRSKQRLQKCPNDQVMAIFARSPQTRLF